MTNSSFHIQKATIGDLNQILQVFHNAVTITACEYYTPQQINAWASTINSTRNKWIHRIENEAFIVAKSNDDIVGFAALKGLSYFDLLFVAPGFGRRGVASQMYDILEAKIPIGTILETHASKVSMSFFLKKGFSVICQNKVDIQGVQIINHSMHKQL
ncbi:Acetyltransferase, GNAT family [Spirosomataceae bacterium TFI 002]|nr:Acetyltransferase, GNAT family [Spirosomataceae bacterium TFI 002]